MLTSSEEVRESTAIKKSSRTRNRDGRDYGYCLLAVKHLPELDSKNAYVESIRKRDVVPANEANLICRSLSWNAPLD